MSDNRLVDFLRIAAADFRAQPAVADYYRALANQTLSREAYIGFIRVLAILHSVVEAGVGAAVSRPAVAAVWSDDLRRAELLLADNGDFRWQLIADCATAVDSALAAARELRLNGLDQPGVLIGAIVALSAVAPRERLSTGRLRAIVEQTAGPQGTATVGPTAGCRYLAACCGEIGTGPAETPVTHDDNVDPTDGFAAILARIAALPVDVRPDDAMVTGISAAAQLVFNCLTTAITAIHTFDRASAVYTVTGLNPESGNYPIPQDPAVLAAVLRASECALVDNPYYVYRYGVRARRYADADGAWLAGLPAAGAGETARQIDWLTSVLSTRGMPRVLIAHHLEILARELAAVATYDDSARTLLRDQAATMRAAIDGVLPESRRVTGVRLLTAALGRRTDDYEVTEAVTILASAVVDECNGLVGAVAAALTYYADNARFSALWVDVVRQLVDTFRRDCKGD